MIVNDPNELKLAYSAIEKELVFSCEEKDEESWMKAFAAHINHLILHDFNKLILILYRLDISESKLRRSLKDQTGHGATTSADLICNLIIERQLEKIKSRNQFSRDENIDENEKW